MFKNISTTLPDFFNHFFSFFTKSQSFSTGDSTTQSSLGKQDKKLPKSSLFVVLGLILFIAILLFLVGKVSTKTNTSASGQAVSQVPAPIAKAHEDLNKTFTFSLKDANGQEITKFTYEIQSADLMDQIIVNGQKATAVAGRTFLILNLKLVNSYTQGISVNTRDYIRLTLNGDKTDLLAPDIHNDPVEVQAISTKLTRLGFPISNTDKNLMLQVGEIKGPKQTIALSL